ncbi:hypothetical protein BJ165DRAFT_1616662 [Panaeolus papilionaceus]|nr:hypothetical protein BJ165DRAFT_1616662 [Panaeolus papilionaceus]
MPQISTAPSTKVEMLKTSIIIYGGEENFEQPISDAMERIKTIRAILEEQPATRMRVELDVNMPKTKKKLAYFKDQRRKLRDLLKEIATIPVIASFSLNLIKTHRTVSVTATKMEQQDEFVGLLLRHATVVGRECKVPAMNVRISARIDDAYPWIFTNAGVKNVIHPLYLPKMKQLCLIMNFQAIPGLEVNELGYSLEWSKKKLLISLHNLQLKRPELEVIYHIQGAMGTPYEFEEKQGVKKVTSRSRRHGLQSTT